MKASSLIIISAWAAFTLLISPAIDSDLHAYYVSHRDYDMPVAWQILGEARSIASNMSLLQADLYMHGGAGHFYEEHQGGMAVEEASADLEHEHGRASGPRPSPYNILFSISDAVQVTEHKHLRGAEIKELIPWLYYAARLDPDNVQAYSLTAFWLGDRLGRVDEAIAFLREGLTYNPSSWELNAEMGRIYCQHLKDYRSAERYLLKAKELMASAQHDKFQERYVLSWLAMAYEGLGRTPDAVTEYKKIQELFPKDHALESKIKKLEAAQ